MIVMSHTGNGFYIYPFRSDWNEPFHCERKQWLLNFYEDPWFNAGCGTRILPDSTRKGRISFTHIWRMFRHLTHDLSPLWSWDDDSSCDPSCYSQIISGLINWSSNTKILLHSNWFHLNVQLNNKIKRNMCKIFQSFKYGLLHDINFIVY